jgi:hypothetical protein
MATTCNNKQVLMIWIGALIECIFNIIWRLFYTARISNRFLFKWQYTNACLYTYCTWRTDCGGLITAWAKRTIWRADDGRHQSIIYRRAPEMSPPSKRRLNIRSSSFYMHSPFAQQQLFRLGKYSPNIWPPKIQNKYKTSVPVYKI